MNNKVRYYIHISSNENRSSILKNGLIPKSIIKSNQFPSLQRNRLNLSYNNEKCIFMSPFGDNIDFYDIANIRSKIFPLPLIAAGYSYDEYFDLCMKGMENVDYDRRIIAFKKRLKTADFVQEAMIRLEKAELDKEMDEEVNRVLINNAKNFDIWIIDSDEVNFSLKEDPGSGEEDAYYTTTRIPPKALTLIKGNIKYRKDFKFEENSLILSFNQWNIMESEKDTDFKFVRFGGLNVKTQKGFGKDSFHAPPTSKGFYAMPYKLQELFLVGSLSVTQPDIFKKTSEFVKLGDLPQIKDFKSWKDFEVAKDAYDKHHDELLKAQREDAKNKMRSIRKEFFKKDGYVWHHLDTDTDPNEIISRNGSWIKSSLQAWNKAVKRIRSREGTEEKFKGFKYSKDHYEVFFDEKV